MSLSASRKASKKIRTVYIEEEEFTIEGDFMNQEIYVYRKPERYGIEYERYTQENIIEKVLVNKVEPLKEELKIDTEVEIGNGVKIQNFVSVYKGVKIADDVFIGPSVTFTNDLYPRAFSWAEDMVISTIGANSTILCGVVIGEYALIGAGSVVAKDVPPFGLMYGNPGNLKGFVCYCGRKLSEIIRADNERIIYKCECGKEVETTRLTQKRENHDNLSNGVLTK